MVTVGLLLMGAVVVVVGGIVADSTGGEVLSFYGVQVTTSSAQVFLTGAICMWVMLGGAWLTRFGIRITRARRCQLEKSREVAEQEPAPLEGRLSE